jgi:hypothetical protein
MLACSSLPFITQNNSTQEPVLDPFIAGEPTEPTSSKEPQISSNQNCINVFYPLLPENQWIYEFTSQEESSQMGMSVSELENGEMAVNMLGLETGVTSQTQIECEDGAIVSFPLMTMGLLMGDYLDGSIEINHISGVFMPNEAAFTNSDWSTSWQGEYRAKGNMQINYDGEEADVLLDNSPIRMNWIIPYKEQPAKETITVEAGTFEDATRIHRTVEMDVSVSMASDGNTFMVDGTIILEQTLWYKENIGLLKQQIDEASIKAFGVQYPIVLDGTVELVEFRN